MSLLSHDRYQYDSLILSKQTWAYPRQHLQQLLWCVVSVRLNLPEVEERKLCPLRYNTNCVSTTLTVLILHNVESVYFFYSNPVLTFQITLFIQATQHVTATVAITRYHHKNKENQIVGTQTVTLSLVFRRPRVQILVQKSGILRMFVVFILSPHENTGKAPQMNLEPLPSTSFPNSTLTNLPYSTAHSLT